MPEPQPRPLSSEYFYISRTFWDVGTIGCSIVTCTLTESPAGVNTNDLCEMSKPSNAPDHQKRIPAQVAGSIVGLLSLAMLQLPERVFAPNPGQEEELA
jgi:hypothetical protein